MKNSNECPGCRAPQVAGHAQCANCGAEMVEQVPVETTWSREQMSKTVRIYTGVLIGWALIIPFLLPIILKISHDHM